MLGPFSAAQRIRTGLSLLLVFALIFATNILDKRHFKTAQNSINSVYEDRLLVKGYIYELNNIFHRKQLLVVTNDLTQDEILSDQARIDTLIEKFSRTQLTYTESKYLDRLQEDTQAFQQLAAMADTSQLAQTSLTNNLTGIQQTLNQLADIQIEEGENILKMAQHSLTMNAFVSKMETWALIIIGIILQFLIFFRPGSKD